MQILYEFEGKILYRGTYLSCFHGTSKFIEPYITVARQHLSNSDHLFHWKEKCLSTGEEFLAVLMRLQLGLLGEDVADQFSISSSKTYDALVLAPA